MRDWLIKKLGEYTDDEKLEWESRVNYMLHEVEEYEIKYEAIKEAIKDKEKPGGGSRRFAIAKGAPANTKLPTRKTVVSAVYDFYLPCDVIIKPYGCSPIIPTGVKAYMQEDEVLLLFIRSSVGILKNVTLSNCASVIDSDYADNKENDGDIGLRLRNNSPQTVEFKKGERIMQGIFVKYGSVANDVATGERNGGTGSTGK